MESRNVNVQQGTTTAPVLQPAEDFRLNHAGLWTPDPSGSRNVRSGVLPGPKAADGNAPMVVIATPATSASVTIKAGHFVVQGATALSGVYTGTVDSDKVRTIAPLPSAGGFKAGRVVIHIYDQVYGDAQDGWDIEILLGTQASSAGAAVLPTIPGTGTYFEIRQFTVDSAGNVSFIGTFPWVTVARGGILPVGSGPTDTSNGMYVGQYRDHPFDGLSRWDGTGWTGPNVTTVAALTPNSDATANPIIGTVTKSTVIGRRYCIRVTVHIQGNVAGDRMTTSIRQGSGSAGPIVTLGGSYNDLMTSSSGSFIQTRHQVAYDTATATSSTWTVCLVRSGTGAASTATISGDSGYISVTPA